MHLVTRKWEFTSVEEKKSHKQNKQLWSYSVSETDLEQRTCEVIEAKHRGSLN